MNKINLELKHYCTDFVDIRKVLLRLGAHKEVVKKQKDYFFELPKKKGGVLPRLKLRIEGKLKTLVYYKRPDFIKTKGTTCDVKLYKVKDNNLFNFLRHSLGIKAVVNKKREVWRKVNTVFHIDNVKNVGGIFEIELQKRNKLTKKDKILFKYYQQKLLPYLGKVIKGSNLDLVQQHDKPN